eukprot:TRINITY_DN15645_c0_g1_i1.p1 TRINITY_DN15645_c0_g1~~TRINITY_DN15645_c0_g1_i1.p1  ORF type:complete len:157 (+),score=20.30 TRINITY_DN15645_c0_g1_i1:83-553(+)
MLRWSTLAVHVLTIGELDVEPVMDRLVLFSSYQTLHRVLPSFAESRYCITLWFEASATTAKFPDFSWLKEVEGIGFILNPANRKSLAKVIYDNDWAESVRESFGSPDDLPKVLESHKKDVEMIKSKLVAELLEFVQSCLPIAHDENFLRHTHLAAK